jgi:hypothetical protein
LKDHETVATDTPAACATSDTLGFFTCSIIATYYRKSPSRARAVQPRVDRPCL